MKKNTPNAKAYCGLNDLSWALRPTTTYEKPASGWHIKINNLSGALIITVHTCMPSARG